MPIIFTVRRSQPCLAVEDQRPTSPDGTHMAPIMSSRFATNSIGYLGD
ncbi:hypothetical protein KCP73_22175 [Salmonella enterica subsp. enterica]|nr:hypothetical protein KCP73_22175 [Salmonella enterica subsp. enterica]